jgi:hypothetical protein
VDTTASNYISNINENYPVTGQNNDSKGFQENFFNIKSALSATNIDVDVLQNVVMKQFQDNDFGGYDLKNANLVNHNTSIALDGDGTDPIDYSQFSFWPITLLDGGINVIQIDNMPASTASGILLVSITPSVLGTLVSFTATTSTVISLGPENQPFDLPALKPYLFEIRNDHTGYVPYTYVKKITREIAFFNPNAPEITSDTFYGNSGIFNSVSLGNNTFTKSASTLTSNIKATVVKGADYIGNIALLPNKIITVITGTDVAPMGGLTNEIAVADPTGIYPGALVYFAGTNSQYTVANVSANIITINERYNIINSNVGDQIVFVNKIFEAQSTATQPTLLSLTNIKSIDDYGNINSGTTYNLKGSVYVDPDNLQVTFDNPGNGPNTFSLSRATTFTNTTSYDMATIGLVNHFIPAGQIIMWYGSSSQVPYGWWLCDGSMAPNGVITPKLGKRFILGANSDYQSTTTSNIVPAYRDGKYGPQTLSGGTATSVLIQHDHLGTATTFATYDPGHQHLNVGANTTSGSSPHPEGSFTNTNVNNSGNGPGGTQFWGFTEGTSSTAVQWWTSPEHVIKDTNPKHTAFQTTVGVTFGTDIIVESTGTVGSNNHANLPPYTALYHIYKWLSVANADNGTFYTP